MSQDTRPTVVITGANPTGIGGALARTFHSAGYRVFATGRTLSKLQPLADMGIELLSLDVTSPSSIASCVETVSSLTNNKLDILINNAGKNYTVPLLHVDESEVRSAFDTNFFGAMFVTKAFAPLMINTRKRYLQTSPSYTSAKHPKILMLGSINGIVPFAFSPTYNASKAALHAFADVTRFELAPFGVAVLTLITGGVRSDIARTEQALPPDSLYYPIEDRYQFRLKQSQHNPMDVNEYARIVLRYVEGYDYNQSWYEWFGVGDLGWGSRLWEGYFARTAWWIDGYLPRWIWDWGLKRRFGLDRLKVIWEREVMKGVKKD